MLSTNRIALALGLLLGGLVAVTTLSSGSNGKVSATFSGTVAHEGVSSHSFTVEREGAVEVELTALHPGSEHAKEIGLGLGTPTPAGNCALVEATRFDACQRANRRDAAEGHILCSGIRLGRRVI